MEQATVGYPISPFDLTRVNMLLGECRTLWGEYEQDIAVHRWCNVVALSSQVSVAILSLLVPCKCGLTVGHTCSVKETEWGRTVGTRV